jgi:hypothetical protein
VRRRSSRGSGGILAEYFLGAEAWAEDGEERGEEAAARRLSIFLVLAREMAVRAARSEGGDASLSTGADRLFAAAHGALRALQPGTNVRLLLEEFAFRLRRGAVTRSGASR